MFRTQWRGAKRKIREDDGGRVESDVTLLTPGWMIGGGEEMITLGPHPADQNIKHPHTYFNAKNIMQKLYE